MRRRTFLGALLAGGSGTGAAAYQVRQSTQTDSSGDSPRGVSGDGSGGGGGSDAAARVADLEAEVERLQAERDQLQSDLDAARAERDRLRGQLAAVQGEQRASVVGGYQDALTQLDDATTLRDEVTTLAHDESDWRGALKTAADGLIAAGNATGKLDTVEATVNAAWEDGQLSGAPPNTASRALGRGIAYQQCFRLWISYCGVAAAGAPPGWDLDEHPAFSVQYDRMQSTFEDSAVESAETFESELGDWGR